MIWNQQGGKKAPGIAIAEAMAGAKDYGVPAGIILGTIERESNFRLGLVSSAGAVGPCQFKQKFADDYYRYAGFSFDLEGWDSVRGLAAVLLKYSQWAVSRHGMTGDDVWRYALCAHRWGQNDARCLSPRTQKRVLDVEAAMRRNGVWYTKAGEQVTSQMNVAQKAVQWALGKVGCTYSQVQRAQAGVFDCSSLVARAYSAHGMSWKHVGRDIPLSCEEVYSDQFELLWPADYASIGKKLGGITQLSLANQPGDLQFLCTSSTTSRRNKITHVTMVTDEDTIVHARSTKYGVRTDKLSLYAGKVCAVVRYNPDGKLCKGMKGLRVAALQIQLNQRGAGLTVDGEYGARTADAAAKYGEA